MALRSEKAPQVDTVELEVPSLGAITGLSYDSGECEQFLGIPYGEVPGRFRRSVPAKAPWPEKRWNGTQLGPYCPQPPRDFYPIPNPPERTWLNVPGTDETKCLNLNISVPKHAPGAKLPVMVFFHGGAFTYSTGSSPIYDGRFLATASALDLGLPTIVVTVTYRLGAYGFLAGRDLAAYSAKHGERGVGNAGIWDQVLALRWIQSHIAAFGGDQARVLAFGQSAGSVSVHCHMHRGEPLFAAAVLQSGLLPLCGIWSVDEYQNVYEKILLELGIPLSLPPDERVARLLAVDEQDLTRSMASVWPIPVVTAALCDDGVLLDGPMPRWEGYKEFSLPSWCPRVMIGDAANECIIWNKAWRTMTAKELLEKMDSYFGSEKAALIARLYEITPLLSAKETFDKIERLTTDGMYLIPNYFAERAAPEVKAYHFDVPSPYDNEWGGLAHHSFDNVMIWGALKHTLPKAQQRIGEEMVAAWVKFANGLDPWESFGKRESWCVFGNEGITMKTKTEDQSRGYAIWEALDREGLVGHFSAFSEELCLKRDELTAPLKL